MTQSPQEQSPQELNGGYEYTTNYVPQGAEDSNGSTAVTTRRGLTLKQGLFAGIGGVVLATTLSACGPNGAPVPKPTTSETPTKAPQSYDQLVASEHDRMVALIEIKAGLDVPALAAAYVDKQNAWWNAGTDPSVAKIPEKYNYTIQDFGTYVANLQSKAYIDALFTPDNKAADYITANIGINATTISKYVQTVKAAQPYTRTKKIVGTPELVASAGNTRTLRITTIENTNDPKDVVNGAQARYDITFISDGKTEKISTATYAP